MVARRFALTAAVALALVTSSGTDATASHYQTATVKMHAPVGSQGGSAWMNCGWHTTCEEPHTEGGPGVDWWPETAGGTCCGTGRNVYFRSWNYMPATDKIGTIKIYNYETATCYETRVDIRDQGGAGSIAGKVIYQHASRSSDPVWVSLYASPAGTYSGNQLAARMVTKEKCGLQYWTGVNVHEKHENGFAAFSKNVGSPPGAIQNQGDCPVAERPCKYLYSAPASSGSVWSRSVSFQVYICANDPAC